MKRLAILVGSVFVAAAPAAPPSNSPSTTPSTTPSTAPSTTPSSSGVLSRQQPVGITTAAIQDSGSDSEGAWNLELSQLCRRYRSPAMDAAVARRDRIAAGERSTSSAARESSARRARQAETEIRREALRELVRRGFTVDARNGVTADRTAALETIASLRNTAELKDAVEVLSGEGYRANLIASEEDLRAALFRALAAEPSFGQARLVLFGVGPDERVAAVARDALPETLSPEALNALRVSLAGQRERAINNAAMIAGAHPAGSLIPSLIQAQFEEASAPQQGDEAWIAIGKSTAYVAGLVPVVGNGSGAFQPIPGVVYEGSVLRIMESAVTIYRTEVYQALVATVEKTTGQPAPPFGFDRDRWLAWYTNEYPRLAQAHAREASEKAISEGVRTSPARADS